MQFHTNRNLPSRLASRGSSFRRHWLRLTVGLVPIRQQSWRPFVCFQKPCMPIFEVPDQVFISFRPHVSRPYHPGPIDVGAVVHPLISEKAVRLVTDENEMTSGRMNQPCQELSPQQVSGLRVELRFRPLWGNRQMNRCSTGSQRRFAHSLPCTLQAPTFRRWAGRRRGRHATERRLVIRVPPVAAAGGRTVILVSFLKGRTLSSVRVCL